MTFLSKPNLVVKKTPLIGGKCDEEMIEVQPGQLFPDDRRVSLGSLMCMTLAAFFITLVGISTGFMMYRQYMRSSSMHRYQGYCTIPISIKDPAFYEPNYRAMPLRWSAEPEVQVFTAYNEGSAQDLINALREQLEIADSVEKITVTENGRNVEFIHDFDSNVTDIVDADRCFSMELDKEVVLSPDVFMLNIAGDGTFDVTHVRSSLRAALPAVEQLQASRDVADKCRDKPTYRLLKDDGVIVRKRSADAPPHDYIQFAGRHVQEIEISNLADLLQHEQAARNY